MAGVQSGQTVRFLFEDSPIGMCTVDADGRVLRRNAACGALMPDDRTSIFDMVHGDDRARLETAMRGVLSKAERAFRLAVATCDARRIEIGGIPMRGGTGDLMLHLVDVTERYVQERRLREEAEHDGLTGLRNRLSFNRALDAQLTCNPSGLLFAIDLDNFKAVNDTHGHAAGDGVLKAVAQALLAAAGEDAIVARLGGDEFAILMPGARAASAAIGTGFIRRIAIAAGIAARGIPVSASIGIAALTGDANATALLEAADRAMYAAKRAGKGRCVIAGNAARRANPGSS